uniref:Uncharacterized protein n=1 Tax=Ixodes ricinus TaxID=34613 RepID=A0A6B0UDG0_IXORI
MALLFSGFSVTHLESRGQAAVEVVQLLFHTPTVVRAFAAASRGPGHAQNSFWGRRFVVKPFRQTLDLSAGRHMRSPGRRNRETGLPDSHLMTPQS